MPALVLAVHPRERGERARGLVLVRRVVRFIPASAGNGAAAPPTTAAQPVHPRERGERAAGMRAAAETAGSSPRARGTGLAPDRRRRHRRFIPASAGNGAAARRSSKPWPVHPRERGERGVDCDATGSRDGSSPRARGTGAQRPTPRVSLRFIPASAGNGYVVTFLFLLRTVHPRERGERLLPARLVQEKPGSSPRARGTD